MPRIGTIAVASLLVGSALAAIPAVAQQQPTAAEMMAAWAEAMAVGPEHEALAARTGTWTMTTTFWMDPSAPPQVEQGTAERTMALDGRVLEERVASQMMGAPFQGTGRMGYDNVTDSYWSTWTDTMSTGLIVMHGVYDADADVYVFEGESVDPLMGVMPMRVEVTIEDDKETNAFSIQGPGGESVPMMEIVYERQ